MVVAVLLIGLWFHQQRQGEVEAYAVQHGLVSADAPWALGLGALAILGTAFGLRRKMH